ncbi:MAG: Thioredoxin [Myxococcaceae bacterium]|nr:Thioredoxin [Myxococcaceae bacterium]
MSTTEITKDNFEGIIEQNDIVVLDCWASWCGPCKTFGPIFEAAAERHTGALWGKLDTENQGELATAFGIRSIPTVMVFRQGILLFQQAGVLPAKAIDEIIGKIQSLDMDEIRQKIEEHEKSHAEGSCGHDHDHNHDHGHGHDH